MVFKPELLRKSDPDLNNLISIKTDKNGELGVQLLHNKLKLRYTDSHGNLKGTIEMSDNI